MTKRISRLNSRELLMIRKFLISRDGHKCNVCGRPGTATKLIVDHVDNDHLNNEKSNLQLCCQSCNIKKNPPYCAKKDVDFSHTHLLTNTNSTDLELKPQSIEMYKNMKAEPAFRKWLEKEMRRYLKIEMEEIINSGAEISEVSTYTIRNNYLKKLCSNEGPYEFEVIDGVKYIRWKESKFPFKNEIKKWVK